MAVMVELKHVLRDSNGAFRYKRRVPKSLQARLGGRSLFIKVLGRSEAEAVANYGPYHKHVERLVRLGKTGGGGLTPRELAESNRALLIEQGADPDSAGRDENEELWRDVAAEEILDKYHRDFDTGEPFGVSPEDDSRVQALLRGVQLDSEVPTLTDAFRFYLSEKGKTDPTARAQQENRLDYVKRIALQTLRTDKRLTDITRSDARAVRDSLISTGMKRTSVQRRLTDLSAVVSFAAVEHGLDPKSPFSNLTVPGGETTAERPRLPLTDQPIAEMYERLGRARPDVREAWTLLHHTGARLREIAGLAGADIVIDAEVPHLVIEPKPWRRLKNRWSERKVPLVGDALRVAREIKDQRGQKDYVFPRYAEGRGSDSLSQTLMKHLRKARENDRQVIHSLRHTMKDALRNAGVSHELACAILGHELSSGIDKEYGVGFDLRSKEQALLRAFPTSCQRPE